MVTFAIMELEDGLTVLEIEAGQSAEDAAAKQGGMLVDPGPFATYDEACDAMLELESDDEDERT